MMTRSASGSGSHQGYRLIKISAARKKNMERGNADLKRWIEDLLEVGIWQIPEREESVKRIAKRLVDAQMGSIAKRIRLAYDAIESNSDWAEDWIGLMGTLSHFTTLYDKLEELPADLMADVWQFAGVFMKKKDVLSLTPVQDNWLVLGESLQREERLLARRTWLFGLRNRKWAMILDYGMNKNELQKIPGIGHQWKAAICFYPSASGFRALVANSESYDHWQGGELGFQGWEAFLSYQHNLILKNPLMDAFPCLIRDVKPARGDKGLALVDCDGIMMPVGGIDHLSAEWKALLAVGPVTIFGEVRGQRFYPWCVYTQNRIIQV